MGQAATEESTIGEVGAALERVELSDKEVQEKVLAPYTYIASMPGKNLRDKFGNCTVQWFATQDKKNFETFKELGHIIHNASLVIDDIQDGSELRRGNPSAHIKYGVPLSINAGYYAAFIGLNKLFQFESLEVIKRAIEGVLVAHEGQGIEIYWRDTLTKDNILTHVPSTYHYENVICKKTYAGFQLSLELAKELFPSEESKGKDFSKFGKYFGLYFQIKDDLMNLCSEIYAKLKGFAEDITEGKLSYPVLVCLNDKKVGDEKKLRLWEILMMRTTELELKKEAVDILKGSGALDATTKRLSEIHTTIFEEIERLELSENPDFEYFFNTDIAVYIH